MKSVLWRSNQSNDTAIIVFFLVCCLLLNPKNLFSYEQAKGDSNTNERRTGNVVVVAVVCWYSNRTLSLCFAQAQLRSYNLEQEMQIGESYYSLLLVRCTLLLDIEYSYCDNLTRYGPYLIFCAYDFNLCDTYFCSTETINQVQLILDGENGLWLHFHRTFVLQFSLVK